MKKHPFKDVGYKQCVTYRRQCKKAKKNGLCSAKERENCIFGTRIILAGR